MIRVDFGSAAGVIGVIRGVTENTHLYANSVMNLSHYHMTRQFTRDAALAANAGQPIKHVFDVTGTGIILGENKLWATRLKGYGGTKTVGYEFLPSKMPIERPTPANTGVAQQYLDKLSNRRYIFRNQAFVLESTVPTNVKPKYAKKIFVPLRGKKTGDPIADERGFIFTTRTTTPGSEGRVSAGKFAAFWTAWWSTRASQVFQTEVEPQLYSDLTNLPIATQIGKLGGRSVSLSVEEGKAVGKAYILELAQRYERMPQFIKDRQSW